MVQTSWSSVVWILVILMKHQNTKKSKLTSLIINGSDCLELTLNSDWNLITVYTNEHENTKKYTVTFQIINGSDYLELTFFSSFHNLNTVWSKKHRNTDRCTCKGVKGTSVSLYQHLFWTSHIFFHHIHSHHAILHQKIDNPSLNQPRYFFDKILT